MTTRSSAAFGRRAAAGSRRRATGVLLALLLLGLSPVGHAEPPDEEPPEPDIVTDRPDIAESSDVVGPGRAQLETGLDVELTDEDSGRVTTLRSPTKLRVGLTRRWEAHLETAGVEAEWSDGGSQVGFASMEFGFKVHLLDAEGAIPSTGLLVALGLPAGSGPGTREDEVTLLPTVAMDWSPGLGLELGVNLGGTFVLASDSEDPVQRLGYAVALWRDLTPLTPDVAAFVEVFGESPLGEGGHEVSLQGGLAWLLAPWLQLDAAARGGLSRPAPDLGVGLGLSVRH